MASNKAAYLKNLGGAPAELRILGLCQAGSTAAIKEGEIVAFGGTYWAPLAADQEMNGTMGVMGCEVAAGDREGYYPVIIPRPLDVFEFELATASAVAIGAALYYSTSQKVTTSGTFILGRVVGQEHYPQEQGHLSCEPSGDAGTTVRSTSYARMVFSPMASYLKTMLGNPNALPPWGLNYSATNGGSIVPICTLCTAGGAESEAVWTATFKCRILRAWMVSEDTNSVNVTLNNGSDAITSATSKGGTDHALIEFTGLIDTYATVAAGAAVTAAFSGAGSATVYLLVMPIV